MCTCYIFSLHCKLQKLPPDNAHFSAQEKQMLRGVRGSQRMNEWANLLLHFLTLGPTVLITKRYSTRYIFNKCFLYAVYLLIQPNTNPPPSPPFPQNESAPPSPQTIPLLFCTSLIHYRYSPYHSQITNLIYSRNPQDFVTVLPCPPEMYTILTIPSQLLTLNTRFFFTILHKARSKKPGTPYGPSPYGTRQYCTITIFMITTLGHKEMSSILGDQ